MKHLFMFFSEWLSLSQKKRKARGKLSSAQKHLKKRLELSYGVQITEEESDTSKSETESQKHLHK